MELTNAREIMERFAGPFARAMAVFVRELAVTDQLPENLDENVNATPALCEEQLMQELARTVAEQGRLAPKGEIESITINDDAVTKAVAARIRWVMRERGMSQVELSQRIGVSPAVVSRVLKNPGRSRVDTIRKLAKALEIEVRDIL